MSHYRAVMIVLRWVALLGSALLATTSISALRAGRRGYKGVLLWALFIPVYLAWAHVSPRLHFSEPWHRVSYSLRMMSLGAFVMYCITYAVPFLRRDCKQLKAERKRAAQALQEGQAP